tara:strand:+ start:1840 stop:2844 length:1005 start_codon:yes stop_codon:yes gene_type:complete
MARGDYLAKTGGGYGKSYQQKTDNLKQSIGSLDRRINNAIKSGDVDQAKDLRSRQNKFVQNLADTVVKEATSLYGGNNPELTIQGNVRTSSGGPILTTKGGELRQSVIDRDFLNSTRRLQNEFPAEMKRMYPISQTAQQGPFAVQAIKQMFGIEDGPIPYSGDGIMPALRYPLQRSNFDPLTRDTEENMAAAEGADIFSNEGDFNAPATIIRANAENAFNDSPYQVMNANSLNDGINLLIDQGVIVPEEQRKLNLGNLFNNFQDGIGALNLNNLGDRFSNSPLVQEFKKLDDGKGLDLNIGDRSLQYRKDSPFNLPGSLTFSLDPNNAGIMYEI